MRSHLVRLESSGEGFDDPYWPRARWTKYSCAPRVNGKRERCLFRGSLAAAVSWEEIDGELHFGLIYEPHLGVDGSQITVSQIICGGTIIDERSARLRHGPLAQFGFRIDPPQLANLNFSIHKGRELLMEVGLQSEVGVEGGPDVFLNVGKRHYDKVIERIRKAIFEAKSSPQNAHYTPEFAAKLQSSFDKPIPH